jgi:hypothetical protein
VVSRLGVFIQAVLPRADLVVAHVRVDYATPAVAAGPLSGPRASASLVEMVTDWLAVVSRPLGLGRVAAAREAGAAPPPSAAATSAAVVVVTVSPAGTALAALLLIAGLPVESRPPVQHIRPPLLGLPHRQGGVPGHGPPGVLPKEHVDEVSHEPAQ